jgi:hypothetical protein
MNIVLALVTLFAGSLLTFAASVVVSRRLATREHRTTLFLTLLPEVLPDLEAGRGTSPDVQRIVERVQRQATVASATDHAWVLRTDMDVHAALDEQAHYDRLADQPPGMSDDAWRRDRNAAEERRREAVQRVGRTLAQYRTWLGTQLGHLL